MPLTVNVLSLLGVLLHFVLSFIARALGAQGRLRADCCLSSAPVRDYYSFYFIYYRKGARDARASSGRLLSICCPCWAIMLYCFNNAMTQCALELLYADNCQCSVPIGVFCSISFYHLPQGRKVRKGIFGLIIFYLLPLLGYNALILFL